MHSRELTPGCWVNSRTGRQIDYLDPNPDEIHLPDIANGLGRVERFLGATSKPYYIAEHTLWCSYAVPEPFALLALHHDDPEYLTGDIPAPFKEAVKRHTVGGDPIRHLEDGLFRAITRAPAVESLGIHWKCWRTVAALAGLDGGKMPFIVKVADLMALAIERRDLCVARREVLARWAAKPIHAAICTLPKLEPLGSEEASRLWLERHRELSMRAEGAGLKIIHQLLVDEMFEAVRRFAGLAIDEQAEIMADEAHARLDRHLTTVGRAASARLELARETMAVYPEQTFLLRVEDVLPFAEPGLTPHAVLLAVAAGRLPTGTAVAK
jgi:hypothetical protein